MFGQPKERMMRSGDVIWQYQVDKHLGNGTFGDVYLAHHQTMKRRQVAIKRLKMREAGQSIIRRFVHEAYAMGELYHPNIVLIYELIEPDKYPKVDSYFIVMEYMNGGTLKDWMERDDAPLALFTDIARVIKEVCRGLAVAHQEKIYHRDIKPENIMLSRDGSRVKIGDWGLVHLEGHQMTVFGDIMGTLTYMPPEQASGHSGSVDSRADLYSVGVMLYEMVTGHVCLDFQQIGEDAAEKVLKRDPGVLANPRLLRQVAQDACYEAAEHAERIDPAVFAPEIPAPLRKLLMKAVAIDPGERFQSAEEFIGALVKLETVIQSASKTSSTISEHVSKVASLLIEARQQRQQKAYEDAIRLLQEAMKIIDGDAGVCLELARIYNLTGRIEEAVRVLTQANKQNPDNYVILRELGVTYYMGMKDAAKAQDALQRSLRLNPNQSEVEKLLDRLSK